MYQRRGIAALFPAPATDTQGVGGEVTRYLTTRAEVEALCKAAHSEGARQERERIRGLELDENVRGLLKGVMHAIHHMPWSTSAWRALLAAITQASEANTHGGAAVTEGE